MGQWFYFLILSILCEVEKVFAKKPGFLANKETEFLILDKVELRFAINSHCSHVK
jgi:hypothetical protein